MYNLVNGESFTAGTAILQDEFGLAENDAVRLYHEIQTENANDWISPWPSYSEQGKCTLEDDLLTCQSNSFRFTLNRTSGITRVPTQQGERSFVSVSFVDSDLNHRVEKPTQDTIPLGVVVFGEPNPNRFIITGANSRAGQHGQDWLPGSIFSRLFYQHGFDLDHFVLFDDRQSLTGTRIITWKVDWDGTKKDAVGGNNKIWIDYIAWAQDGGVFESSVDDWKNLTLPLDVEFSSLETTPFPYSFSGNFPIGFKNEIAGMKEGKTRSFILPPETAFTDTNHPLFNQTVQYKVRIVKIA